MSGRYFFEYSMVVPASLWITRLLMQQIRYPEAQGSP